MADAKKNLAYTLVLAAPSPAISGTTLDVTAGTATRFPAVPFNATVWPALAVPHAGNAEIVRVTNITGDTFTITRAQEGTSARTILVGDQIANTVTKLTFDDIESAVSVVSQALSVETAARVAGDNSLSQAVSVVSNAASHALSVGALAMSLITTDVSAARVSLAQAVSVLSQQVSALSQNVSTLSAANAAAHTSLEAHASTASAAATSVDARVTSVQSAVSALQSAVSNVSATSAGGGSATGLQAVINALSNKISATAGGTASVTSAEYVSTLSVVSHLASGLSQLQSLVSDSLSIGGVVSANVTSLQSTVSALRSAVSNVSATSAGGGSATGLQAVIDALSNKISGVTGGAGSVTSAEAQAISAQAASAISQLNSVVSQGFSVVSQALSVLSQGLSALSNANSAAHVSINDRISVASALASAADAHASIASAAVTSVDTRVNTVSNQVSVLSQQVSVLSQQVSVLSQNVSAISVNVVSLQSTVSHMRSAVSNVSATSLGGGSATGLQAVIDALSNKISGTAAGAQSVTSAEYVSTLSVVSHLASGLSQLQSVVSNALSAGDVVSNKISALSVTVSLLHLKVSGQLGSVNSVNRANYVSVANVICAATITDISGTTVSISAGGIYELHGAIVYSVSTTTGHGFGITFAACSVAGFRIHGSYVLNQAGASTFSTYATGSGDETDSGSIIWSVAAPTQAGRHMVSIEGLFQCSATGTIIAGARGSVATNAITIHRGSFLRVWRIN